MKKVLTTDNLDVIKRKIGRVENIEKLKQSNLKVGDVIEVLGYYSADDGATHKRVIASEDDGSGVQLINKLWANIIHNGEVNVSWFGAKGDEVTDDTASIQKALNFCDNIQINKGIFKISNTLLIDSNTSFTGDESGKTTILKLGTGEWNYHKAVISNKKYSSTEVEKDKNIFIKNLKLVADRSGKSATCCLNICNVKDSIIENVATDGAGYGIRVGFSNNIKVYNCLTEYAVDDGIALSDGDLIGNYENNNYIYIEKCISRYNAMDSSVYEHMNGEEGTSGFEADDGGTNLFFIDCLAYENGGRGFNTHIHGGDNYSSMENITYLRCIAHDNKMHPESKRKNYPHNGSGFSTETSNCENGNYIRNIEFNSCISYNQPTGDFTVEDYEQNNYDRNVRIINCQALSTIIKTDRANIFAQKTNGITIENTIIDCGGNSKSIEIKDTSNYFISFKNNIIKNCIGQSLSVSSNEILNSKASIVIEKNKIISDTGKHTNTDDNLIYLKNIGSFEIKNNIIKRTNGKGAPIITSPTAKVGYLYGIVDNNILEINNSPDIENEKSIGIWIVPPSSKSIITIRGNTLQGNLKTPISLFKDDRDYKNLTCIVTNNVINTTNFTATNVFPEENEKIKITNNIISN